MHFISILWNLNKICYKIYYYFSQLKFGSFSTPRLSAETFLRTCGLSGNGNACTDVNLQFANARAALEQREFALQYDDKALIAQIIQEHESSLFLLNQELSGIDQSSPDTISFEAPAPTCIVCAARYDLFFSLYVAHSIYILLFAHNFGRYFCFCCHVDQTRRWGKN
jgi:hypothetical protein